MTQRFQRHPYLALFDGPDPNTSTAQRSMTTVPQQALFLMNNPFVTEQAEGLARRLLAATPQPRVRIERTYAWAWSRPASAREVDRGLRFVADYARAWLAAGLPLEQRELAAWTSYARLLFMANEFVFLD